MELDIERLRDSVCRSLCADVQLHPRQDHRVLIETPFAFEDGDSFVVLAEPLPTGGVRLTDGGHTLMHLSYSMDVDNLRDGNRGELFRKILADAGINELDGEVFLDVPADHVGPALFRFGQALTRVYDLTLLNRTRVASTFYDDLESTLSKFVPANRVVRGYVVPDKPRAADYPVDFKIDTRDASTPLFLFGVPNADKAKLTTIIIEHWLRENVRFDSLLVFADQTRIGRADLARLSNVGGEMVASLDASEDLKRKVERRL